LQVNARTVNSNGPPFLILYVFMARDHLPIVFDNNLWKENIVAAIVGPYHIQCLHFSGIYCPFFPLHFNLYYLIEESQFGNLQL